MKKLFIIKMTAYLYELMLFGSISTFEFDMTKGFLKLTLMKNNSTVYEFSYIAVDNISTNSINNYVKMHVNLINEKLQKQNNL